MSPARGSRSTRPDGLQVANVAGVQRCEVLPDGVSKTRGARLPTRKPTALENSGTTALHPTIPLIGTAAAYPLATSSSRGGTSRKPQLQRSCRVARVLSRSVLAFRHHWQHNGAMPKAITIRDVPDATSEELAARAALTGRSLQEYLRSLLVDIAGRPDAEAWVAKVRARKDATGSAISVEQVLAHRDADRA